MRPVRIGRYLIQDPEVCHGKLTFKGTRVPVETVLNRLGKGRSIDQILKSWPELRRAAITEAIHLAPSAITAGPRRCVSQLILDDQLDVTEVLPSIRK